MRRPGTNTGTTNREPVKPFVSVQRKTVILIVLVFYENQKYYVMCCAFRCFMYRAGTGSERLHELSGHHLSSRRSIDNGSAAKESFRDETRRAGVISAGIDQQFAFEGD